MISRYLADTSSLVRIRHSAVRQRLAPLIEAGDVAICSVVELEVLYAERSHKDVVETREGQRASFELVPMQQEDFDRAVEVLAELARRGRHRAAPVADLLIAAAAERSGRTLIHYDADFELIAAVTGQPQEWVVPRGSLP